MNLWNPKNHWNLSSVYYTQNGWKTLNKISFSSTTLLILGKMQERNLPLSFSKERSRDPPQRSRKWSLWICRSSQPKRKQISLRFKRNHSRAIKIVRENTIKCPETSNRKWMGWCLNTGLNRTSKNPKELIINRKTKELPKNTSTSSGNRADSTKVSGLPSSSTNTARTMISSSNTTSISLIYIEEKDP